MRADVRVILTCLAVALAASPACKGKRAPEKAEEPRASEDGGEAEHDELPKVVKLDAEPRARAGVRSEPAKKEALAKTLTLSGEIVADPDRTAKISSPVFLAAAARSCIACGPPVESSTTTTRRRFGAGRLFMSPLEPLIVLPLSQRAQHVPHTR